MQVKFLLILSIGIATLFSRTLACDCVQNKLEKSIQFTDAIISGKFIQGEALWELSKDNKDGLMLYYNGKFVITQVLKGSSIKVGDTLQVTSDYSNCSTLYKNDINYLLFAETDKGNIKTDICSYSGILDEDKTKKNLKEAKRLLRKRLVPA